LLTLGGALALPGCGGKLKGMFKFQGTITKTKMNADGTTTTETKEYDDWDEMKADLAIAAKELRQTTKALITTLTEVPPPGRVKLGDLSASFAQYEGNTAFDFIVNADSDDDGFAYVQIGVPSYDEFFKAAAEFHAFVFQTKESILRLRTLAQARIQATMNGRVEAKMSLGDVVALALRQAPGATGDAADAAAGALGGELGEGVPDDLLEMRDLALSLARSGPEFVDKTQNLIASGKQLVTAAPTSIVNPKVVLHLDLIIKGLEDSVKVVGSSGKLLVELVKELGTLRE
jgi:hypothetical protein